MSSSLPSFPHYSPEKWMSYIPNTICLNKLRIPGTHNSGSGGQPSNIFKKVNFAAHCQTLDILTQLRRGIRYIDVRLKLEPDGELNVYHKVVRYDVTFTDILNMISDFLTENSEECIMIRLHREDGDPGRIHHRKEVSDQMFVEEIVKRLKDFEDKERTKRLDERRNNDPSRSNTNNNNVNNINENNNDEGNFNIENIVNYNNNNSNISNIEDNDDESLNAIYNKDNDNPLLGEVRRKIILFGIRHVVDTEQLRASPFKFREINKQAEFKLKCNDNDIEKKKKIIIEGFRESMSVEFENSLFVNEINAIGSLPFLSFIPYPRKIAEIMNNITESFLIQLIKDKTHSNDYSGNLTNNNNENQLSNNENHNNLNSNSDISNQGQNENNNYENDFQGVLLFDFPEVSKVGNLIELVYAQNFI